MRLIILILLLAINLSFPNSGFGKDIGLSQITMNKIKSVFGNNNLIKSKKLHIRVKEVTKNSKGISLVEGPYVHIESMYIGSSNNIGLIAFFIDGNEKPLISTIVPGDSIADKPIRIQATGKPDNDCYADYQAVIVIKENKSLIYASLPFYIFISDCDVH